MSEQPPKPGRAPAGEHSLGALLVGVIAGLIVFVGMVAGAILLYQRVYGDSLPALLILLVLFGGLGAYLAWLVGVLIFSTVRSTVENGGEAPG